MPNVNPDQAQDISVDSSAFSNNLGVGDNTFQAVADVLDGLNVGAYPEDSVLVVPRGATPALSGTNLKTTYNDAKSLKPGGNDLSTTNRATVIVPAGVYDVASTGFNMNAEFIDVIGHGICRRIGPYTNPGKLVIPLSRIEGASSASEAVIHATANDFLLQGFHVRQKAAAFTLNETIIRIDHVDGAPKSRYIDIAYSADVLTRGISCHTQYYKIAGYFEECHSLGQESLADTTYGPAEISAKFIRCTGWGIANSYGGPTEFSGYAEDCEAGGSGFGVVGSGDGDATCSGKVIRCKVGTYGFGFGGDVAGDVGIFTGYAEDCECYARGGFGAAKGTGDVNSVFGGTAIRCKTGTTSDTAAFGGRGIVTTTGRLIDCEAGPFSFGRRLFDGYGYKLIAAPNSFPYTGSYVSTGVLEKCQMLASGTGIIGWNGVMRQCVIECTAGGSCVALYGDDAILDRCILLAGTGDYTVTSSSTKNVRMSRCQLNKDMHADVTNLISFGNNIIDADVAI
jgi:hypothetical protein